MDIAIAMKLAETISTVSGACKSILFGRRRFLQRKWSSH
jgi:hypothetical protein